ncbi:hypothetical protein GPECTOR_6g592 [Gonium pectorale]|uniref:G-patch domain-containing protein n=1 Tax=Gonium pectorale TaxID=33097 RepID=A0A150GUY7_GONPE|nr:hypothetical protein GPECTOR_6g592 [Gonium pectorale]|eukprot:KXZ53675.1 hypothetical protein GPECTOR_6g592 [Gonium pectorale]
MAGPLAPNPLFQGVDKQSAGYKLLASMGWKEGEGLGAKKQGITEHVKVKKKHDAMGVGAAENANSQRDWTTGMVSFDRILANLKEVTATRKEAPDAGGNHSSSSDEENDETRKKGKKGKKAAKKAEPSSDAKRKRASPRPAAAESSSPSKVSGRSSSGSDDDDDSEGPGIQAKRLKLASHVGRYSKRERAKFVKNYSASDLDAILGGVAGSKAADDEDEVADGATGVGSLSGLPDGMSFMPVIAEVRAARAAQDDDSDGGSSDEEEDAAAGAAPAPSGPIAQTEATAAKPPRRTKQRTSEQEQQPPQAEEWEPGKKPWWAGMFVRAGRMGSIRQELKGGHHTGKAKINVSGFREQDQENLYEQAQHGAAHGRQGLGRGDMPKKVAGARWCGTKTKLGDEDEEDEDAGSGPSGSGSDSESEDDGQIVVVQSKKEQADAAAAAGVGAGPAGEEGGRQGQAKEDGQRKRKSEDQRPGLKADSDGSGKKSKKAKKASKCAEQGNAETAAVTAPAAAAAATTTDGEAEADVATGGATKRPKWRKLVQQLLADAPERRIKLKKLKKQLAASHGVGSGKGADDDGYGMSAVLDTLRGSKKFIVCDKFVTLANK